MCRVLFFILMISASSVSIAQKKEIKPVNPYAAVDAIALKMPDSSTKSADSIANYVNKNFSKEEDKARAVFTWIANNISYDIDNMFAINFYEEPASKISKVLINRKGICENYAALFNEVCNKAGIKSFVITGFTKQPGFIDYLPHAWCAAKVDNKWYLFDPTWGSGYVSNGKFARKINNSYFKADPAAFIKTHMPFDYLWQFLQYSVTAQEFYEGKTSQDKTKSVFIFTDSINTYEKQNHIEQLKSTARRIEKNGLRNSMLFDRLQHIKLEIENSKQNKNVNLYNAATIHYNQAINGFNTYIEYYNKQFIPSKPDIDIQQMVTAVGQELGMAKDTLQLLTEPPANIITLSQQLNKSIADLSSRVAEQEEWLKKYFSKGKLMRKSMFYKYSWFGIPLN